MGPRLDTQGRRPGQAQRVLSARRRRRRRSGPICVDSYKSNRLRRRHASDRRQCSKWPRVRSQQHRRDIHQPLIDQPGLQQRAGKSRSRFHEHVVDLEFREAREHAREIQMTAHDAHAFDARVTKLLRRRRARISSRLAPRTAAPRPAARGCAPICFTGAADRAPRAAAGAALRCARRAADRRRARSPRS